MKRGPFVLVILICFATLYAQNQKLSLKETLDWMNTTFPDSSTEFEVSEGVTREFTYIDGQGNNPPSCTVTLVNLYKLEGKHVTRDTIIDLSLIDPNSIHSYADTVLEGEGTLTMVAANDKKIILEKFEEDGKSDDNPYTSERVFISFINPEYAGRFAIAFKNAVSLCGGKN